MAPEKGAKRAVFGPKRGDPAQNFGEGRIFFKYMFTMAGNCAIILANPIRIDRRKIP